MKAIAATMMVAGAAAVGSQAELIAYEPFSYAAGSQLNGLDGGSGNWAGAWGGATSTWQIVAGDYTDPLLAAQPAPAGHLTITDGNRNNATRAYTDGTGTERWVAVMFKQGGQVTMYRGAFNFTDATWSIGVKNGEAFLGNGYDGWDAGKAIAVDSAAEHLIVARVNTSTKEVGMWLNPTAADLLAAPDLSKTYAGTVWNNLATIASKNLSSNGGWDYIRIGTDATDVLVPEPASLALLGLGGLALVARRRR